MATRERWARFDKHMQLLNIIAELERARVWQEQGNAALYSSALERALELVDFSLDEPKWGRNKLQLLILREEVAKFYCGERKESVAELCRIL
ncbi:MAG: hypothetical protein HYY10_04175 [Candidatus Liptonbacteria bacterium]|nr:hypothetical protein [Candidatus Liptonbacteria bacterium]